MRPFIALALFLTLPGCLAKAVADTAVGIVKVPYKVGSKAVDLATESDEEKNEKYIKRERERAEAACETWEVNRTQAEYWAKKSGDWSNVPPPPNAHCE
ncbi:hypothetical protein ACSMXM_16220 [Pacificimonas sp. ICDLI1SI03]|jgi:hypothetical protein